MPPDLKAQVQMLLEKAGALIEIPTEIDELIDYVREADDATLQAFVDVGYRISSLCSETMRDRGLSQHADSRVAIHFFGMFALGIATRDRAKLN